MKVKSTKVTPKNRPLYAAVDLHKDNGYYVIIDGRDRRLFSKRLPNNLEVVLRELEPYRPRLTQGIAVESTYNWYWLVDGLQAKSYAVTLVNPAKLGDYGGLKHTTDQTDAFWLAHLQRLKLLPQAYIYPVEQRGVRDLLRRRMLLVEQRTAHVLSFQSLLERQTGTPISTYRCKRLEEKELSRLLPQAEPRLMGQTNQAVIEFLDTRIEALEQAALKKVHLQPAYERLLTIPGIGRILALVIMLETGAISRFAQVGNYVSYCRCVKAEALSNARKKADNNRKCGNKYLAWAYLEAAHFAIRYCPEIQRWYQRKLARCGGLTALALKAVAAKLAKAAYFMLRDQVPFKRDLVFG